jgi:protein TonB
MKRPKAHFGLAIGISLSLHTGLLALVMGSGWLGVDSRQETVIEMVPGTVLGAGAGPRSASMPGPAAVEAEPDAAAPAQAEALPGAGQEPGLQEAAAGGQGPAGRDAASLIAGALPRYPAEARRAGREGVVLLRLKVSEQGRVEEVQVAAGSGYGPFDEEAAQAVRRWKFKPALKDGQAMASVQDVRVKFRLDSL